MENKRFTQLFKGDTDVYILLSRMRIQQREARVSEVLAHEIELSIE